MNLKTQKEIINYKTKSPRPRNHGNMVAIFFFKNFLCFVFVLFMMNLQLDLDTNCGFFHKPVY